MDNSTTFLVPMTCYHGDPKRGNRFCVYPSSERLETRYDTHVSATEYCGNHRDAEGVGAYFCQGHEVSGTNATGTKVDIRTFGEDNICHRDNMDLCIGVHKTLGAGRLLYFHGKAFRFTVEANHSGGVNDANDTTDLLPLEYCTNHSATEEKNVYKCLGHCGCVLSKGRGPLRWAYHGNPKVGPYSFWWYPHDKWFPNDKWDTYLKANEFCLNNFHVKHNEYRCLGHELPDMDDVNGDNLCQRRHILRLGQGRTHYVECESAEECRDNHNNLDDSAFVRLTTGVVRLAPSLRP